MSYVRVQKLPLLPTFIIRAYPEENMPGMSDFQLVCTMQETAPDTVWLHGMLGISNRRIWRAIGKQLVSMGYRYIMARRAPGRILPGGKTMPDGSLQIDLVSLMDRPRDTGFSPL